MKNKAELKYKEN